jgi:hypothetical protein
MIHMKNIMHLLITGLAVCSMYAHPFYIENEREVPPMPPPARLFVSAEGRYAIQQGWLTGADYQENKIATHGEAVAMILYIAALQEDSEAYGIITFTDNDSYNPESVLTRRDFARYLGRVFYLPDGEIAEMVIGNSDPDGNVTHGEMARVAYCLRGLNPHALPNEDRTASVPPPPSTD